MKFVVHFRTQRGAWGAVAVGPKQCGYELVKAARDELGLPKLAADLVSGPQKVIIPTVEIQLSEAQVEEASEYGLFADECDVDVIVPGEGLNSFLVRKLHVTRAPATGAVIHAKWAWEIDTQALYQAWADARFPREWNPEGGDETEGGVE